MNIISDDNKEYVTVKKQVLYSVYDVQCGRYLYTGRNSTTKQEAIDDAYEYLTSDWDTDDVNATKHDKEGTLNMFELFVEEYHELFENY